MPSISDLRSALGPSADGQSDQALVSQYATAAGMDPGAAADMFGYNPGRGSVTGNRLAGAGSSWKANYQGLGSALARGVGANDTANWLDQARQDSDFDANVDDARAKGLGGVQDWADVHGVGDAASYGTGVALGAAPTLAEFAVTGGMGSVLSGASGTLRAANVALRAAQATGDMADIAEAGRAVEAAAQVAGRAHMAGAAIGEYPSSVGSMLSDQRAQGGNTDLGSAAALAVPFDMLNFLEPAHLAAAKFGGLPTTGIADAINGVRGVAARTGVSAVEGAAMGAAGMGGQAVVGQAARMAVDPNATMSSPDAVARYKNAVAGGAILGGVAKAGLGGWRRGEAPAAVDDTPGATTDILQPDASTSDPAALALGYDANSTPGVVGRDNSTYFAFPDGSVASAADLQTLRDNGKTPEQLADARQRALAQQATTANPGTGLPVQDQINQATGVGVSNTPDNYAAQFAAAADDPTGNRVSTGPDQHEQDQTAFLEQQRQQGLAAQAASDEQARTAAAAKYAQDRAAATTEMVQPDPNTGQPPVDAKGKPRVSIGPQEVDLHRQMTSLLQSGVITPDQHLDMLARIRNGFMSEKPKSGLTDVRRQIKELTKPVEPPEVAPDAPQPQPQPQQPDVPVPASVAPETAAAGGDKPAGSGADMGRVAPDPGQRDPGAAAEPAPSVRTAEPAGDAGAKPAAPVEEGRSGRSGGSPNAELTLKPKATTPVEAEVGEKTTPTEAPKTAESPPAVPPKPAIDPADPFKQYAGRRVSLSKTMTVPVLDEAGKPTGQTKELTVKRPLKDEQGKPVDAKTALEEAYRRENKFEELVQCLRR